MRTRGGFLLLEALIGLAIIGIVAIALLAATAAQVRSADKASVLLVAGALAQDRLAAIQLLDYESLGDPPDSLLAGSFPPPFDAFAWDAEVTPSDGEYDLFAVRVQVSGNGEAFPLQTLIHRPQPVVAVDGEAGQGGRGGGARGRGGRGGDDEGGRGGRGGGGRGGGGRGGGAGGGGRGPGGAAVPSGPGGGGGTSPAGPGGGTAPAGGAP